MSVNVIDLAQRLVRSHSEVAHSLAVLLVDLIGSDHEPIAKDVLEILDRMDRELICEHDRQYIDGKISSTRRRIDAGGDI